MAIKIGIIGGTGLEKADILEGKTEKNVETPYGQPSSPLVLGRIKGVECVLLSRHGRRHEISPTNVNYRANIYSLKAEGCTHVLVATACGSLREEMEPGHFVMIDQFIDRTTKRSNTFYDGSQSSRNAVLPGGGLGVCHIPMADPFCGRTRRIVCDAAEEIGLKAHPKGTMVTIEGPRFSTRAESHMFRQWGADVINMTTVPEVQLAKEAGLLYAAIAMATDYDCWRDSAEGVNVEMVLATLKGNAEKAQNLILAAVPKIGAGDWHEELVAVENEAKFSVLPS